MRVLVVEDESTLARHLCRGLEEAAFTVDVAESVDDAWRRLLVDPYDAVILDLGLPGVDGTELLRRLRESGSSTPVLVLTARGGLADRVAGLNAGADDYLGKPFAFSELLARLRAVLRRGHGPAASILVVGDLHLDVLKRQARRGERVIDLTTREFAVLELLMRHADEVVTRTMIADHVWGDDYDTFSNLIEVFVNRLRRKTEVDAAPRLIHTVRGAGYVIRERAS